MSKLTHLGTCRIIKASTLGAILKLTKNSRYSGMALSRANACEHHQP